jgi:hypothetical protein
VLLNIKQQVQPALSIALMQSQQPWIILPHSGSPLVQATQTPLSVVSHLHMPMVKLQQQTVVPFIITQQLHMPPASIVHRFCTMLTAVLSSQEQVIFIPPVHFSMRSVQRGTINQFMLGGMAAGVPTGGVITPGDIIGVVPVPGRSVVLVLDITELLSRPAVVASPQNR